MMKLAVIHTFKVGFILGIISALLSLALYSSQTAAQNGLSKTIFNLTLELTEEEEERTVREIPETDFYLDHVATAKLNEKANNFNFPIYLPLSSQEFQKNLRKPPRHS